MEEINFKTITDLYKRVYPALTTKKLELRKEKIIISELEMWNYLREEKWSDASDLSLHNMVDDILNLDIESLFKKKGRKDNDN